jgi:hypothetical protein
MIIPAILVGGVLFWTFLAAFVILFILIETSANNDTTAWTGVVLTTVFVTLLALFSDATLPQLTWQYVLFGAVAYVSGGVAWTLFSWVRFLTKMKAQLEKLRRDSDAPGLADAYERHYGRGSFPPKPKGFKGLISRWLIWWPVSVFCFLFTDLLNDVFEGIYKFLSGFLTRLSLRIFE